MLESLPPELFARVLEIAIDTWGIGFLPPICLVSSRCYQVVLTTPSLWGILVVGKDSSVPILSAQLNKVKESELRLTFTRGWNRKPVHKAILPSLAALVHNWVQVDMPTSALTSSARWVDMGRVEALALHYHGIDQQAVDKFFESSQDFVPRNLHSFSATGLPEEWVAKILSSRITYFEITRVGLSASTVQRYLSLVPNVHTLHIERVTLPSLWGSSQTVHLYHLTNLRLQDIGDLTHLLVNMQAPALRTLSIRDCRAHMGLIFSQWSQAGFVPSALQSLELSHCLSQDDTPFLVAWLSRLPFLLRLTIAHECELGYPTASVHTDLFAALSSPDGAGSVIGSWLCPSLIHLCLDTTLRSVADVLPIARARRTSNSCADLQSFQVQLCSSGTPEERMEFRSLFAEPEGSGCVCLACGFDAGLV